ncbi:hypothetical protein [Nitrosopumilus piranensis]|uniref:Uncharacterized protein n=1 Tax=Nitrosopumilus piranensis TaxID=1582439 RepID=A0A0C5BSE1_9ARCH|nr:hypothetical protein [Nitrosopumilus piranensis]AJM92698.1 conserved exported protein of unknown function [Nitrosopumilus piranensis]
MNKTEKISLITAIGTVIVAFAVGIQSYALLSEFESINRPWIGITKFEETPENKINYIYENFGKIPNTDGKIRVVWTEDIYDDFIEKMYDKPAQLEMGVLLPTQTLEQTINDLPLELIQKSKNGDPLYVGVLIKYDYLDNKEGEYGTMMEFVNGEFSIVKTWLK